VLHGFPAIQCLQPGPISSSAEIIWNPHKNTDEFQVVIRYNGIHQSKQGSSNSSSSSSSRSSSIIGKEKRGEGVSGIDLSNENGAMESYRDSFRENDDQGCAHEDTSSV